MNLALDILACLIYPYTCFRNLVIPTNQVVYLWLVIFYSDLHKARLLENFFDISETIMHNYFN